ncbi:sulfur reduction protein DsrE [Enterococcus camelliae]|uniref:Sulfur reduction protein DsrE n=1 Tax=Enterococcus camelliae TaxID=453959 RepID=A0ABW5TEX2_9ENTE
MKVVFHIDEQKKWAELQANVRNFFVAEPQATIVVVANGVAVQGFLLADFYDFFATTPAQLHACQNALRVQKIDFHALPLPFKLFHRVLSISLSCNRKDSLILSLN